MRKKYQTDAERKAAQVASTLRHRASHREEVNAYRRKYAQENPEKIRGYMQKWYYKNHKDTLAYHTNYRERLREEVIEAYGGSCRCCGEREHQFLTVDHVHGWAKNPEKYRHTKRQRGSTHLYLWLRKNRFPKDGFALLCFNCNQGRQRVKDSKCAHENFNPMSLVSAC